MKNPAFDLVVIGAGPGGYVAAIKAAQMGLSVACIERDELGGTCLNVGCIPSKALLDSSFRYWERVHADELHGIMSASVSLDLQAVMNRKASVVQTLTQGIAGLFKKYGVTYVRGVAQIAAPGMVRIDDQILHCKNIIIATGSTPITLPHIKIDEGKIVSSTGALSLKEVPKSMVVVGGGYIGLELGSVWSRYGSAVTVLEAFDRIVPSMDTQVGRALHAELVKQGIKIRCSVSVESAIAHEGGVEISIKSKDGQEKINCDVLLLSIGRKPNTHGLGIETNKIALDERGRIVTDENYQTSVRGIYAIGDVIAGPMLAHKAEEEAIACVERLLGKRSSLNYKTIPSVIYTEPEVASVGLTEEEVKSAGRAYKIGMFPFAANGRAIASGYVQGFVKLLSCSESDEILGCHVIGYQASNLIAQLVLAMEYGASSEDLACITYAHPTLAEAVKEAALSVSNHQIHL